jgi:uncharacterized 2Fe-2S/4Fe-4S cluster protein (DUF4445 family)
MTFFTPSRGMGRGVFSLDKKKVTVLFQPSGRRGEVETGRTILAAAQELGVNIESLCGGKHTCGKCRVRVKEGDSQGSSRKSPKENLSLFQPEENKFISEQERKAGYRLACVAELQNDVFIHVPEDSHFTPQIIRKDLKGIAVELNPAVKAYTLGLTPPTLQEPLADWERLKRALEETYGLADLNIDILALQSLPQRLRGDHWQITAFVWMDHTLMDVQPGSVENFYGLAVDIGTTTVAAYLCDLKNGQVVAADSMMNPQVMYGEDVMTRIAYTMTHREKGLDQLREAIVKGVNVLAQSTAKAAGIVTDHILEMVVVGNTAMHHIFLGINPQPLGLSPFSPAVHHSLNIRARDLGLKIHPAANVHILPIEAGFVGADNVGVLIAEAPYEQEEMTLIIDVGTNGELLLGNRERVLSASCATGPALEGAHIRFGMRAAPGAIERVRIDPETLDVKFKAVGADKWSDECDPSEIRAKGICGSGIIEAVAEMFKVGAIVRDGRMNRSLSSSRLRQADQGLEFVIARAEETAMGQDITISTSDIRAVQLAKGALYAGARILMKVLGVQRLEKVILAGGFGSTVDPLRAMILGMFPDCPLEKVLAVGNAAGEGARLALLNRFKRSEADRMARWVEYVELTSHPDFTEEFVQAMAIPHLRDDFPHLEKMNLQT